MIRFLVGRRAASVLLSAVSFGALAPAQVGPAVHPIDPVTGLAGHLVLVGGGGTPEAARQAFAQAAGGRSAPLVLIPTATSRADEAAWCAELVADWKERGWSDVTVLHTRDREEAATPEFLAPLRSARAVWISGGQQGRLADVYASGGMDPRHPAQAALHALLERGGVIGGTSAGASIASSTMIRRGSPRPELDRGLGLLQDVVVDQHFRQRNRQPRLRRAVAELNQPPAGVFGIGLDERTAVWIHGRSGRVLGDGGLTARWAAGAGRPAREVLLESGARFDLVQWRRAARMRSGLEAPTSVTGLPAGATLVIGGGGRLTREVLERFVEAAGGADSSIVVVPTAGSFEAPRRTGMVDLLRGLGAGEVSMFHPTSLRAPGGDALAVLERATGVWFNGGRQWRLVDAYAETETERGFRAVLERGGVVGGSSAGATIQGELMVRGHPLGNTVMLAEGYLQGFGYLAGCAIDQHFTERKRLPDLVGVVRRMPAVLGIGLDEGTAIVVRDGVAEVLGKGSAWWVDARAAPRSDPVIRPFPAGSRIVVADPLKN